MCWNQIVIQSPIVISTSGPLSQIPAGFKYQWIEFHIILRRRNNKSHYEFLYQCTHRRSTGVPFAYRLSLWSRVQSCSLLYEYYHPHTFAEFCFWYHSTLVNTNAHQNRTNRRPHNTLRAWKRDSAQNGASGLSLFHGWRKHYFVWPLTQLRLRHLCLEYVFASFVLHILSLIHKNELSLVRRHFTHDGFAATKYNPHNQIGSQWYWVPRFACIGLVSLAWTPRNPKCLPRSLRDLGRHFGFLGVQAKLTSPLHANLGTQYLIHERSLFE